MSDNIKVGLESIADVDCYVVIDYPTQSHRSPKRHKSMVTKLITDVKLLNLFSKYNVKYLVYSSGEYMKDSYTKAEKTHMRELATCLSSILRENVFADEAHMRAVYDSLDLSVTDKVATPQFWTDASIRDFGERLVKQCV